MNDEFSVVDIYMSCSLLVVTLAARNNDVTTYDDTRIKPHTTLYLA